jgi:hypothetical protein
VSLQSFLSSRLAKYKLPTVLHLVHDIPKNAMGKVPSFVRGNLCVLEEACLTWCLGDAWQVNKKTLLQTLGLTAPPQ